MNFVKISAVALLLMMSALANAQQCNVPNCTSCNNNQPNSCMICAAGFNTVYLSSTQVTCSECNPTIVPNCTRCNGANYCGAYDCQNGFAEYKGKCLTPSCSIANCQICNAYDTNSCQTCKSGFSVSSTGKCTQCSVTGCSECYADSTNQCKFCSQSFTLGSDFSCYSSDSTCPSDCAKCANGACTVCRPGFAVSNGKCIASISFTSNVATTTVYSSNSCSGNPLYVIQVSDKCNQYSGSSTCSRTRCTAKWNSVQPESIVEVGYSDQAGLGTIRKIDEGKAFSSCWAFNGGSAGQGTCQAPLTINSGVGAYMVTTLLNTDFAGKLTCTGDACCNVVSNATSSNVEEVLFLSSAKVCAMGTQYSCGSDGTVAVTEYSNYDCSGFVRNSIAAAKCATAATASNSERRFYKCEPVPAPAKPSGAWSNAILNLSALMTILISVAASF